MRHATDRERAALKLGLVAAARRPKARIRERPKKSRSKRWRK